MRSIIFKILSLVISVLVCSIHASDGKGLSFTQDDYYKMSVPELKHTKQVLKGSIAKNRKEAAACAKHGSPCCEPACMFASVAIIVKVASDPSQTDCCNAAYLCGLGILATADSWYPWYVTRPQRAELSKINLALLKKLDECEKKD